MIKIDYLSNIQIEDNQEKEKKGQERREREGATRDLPRGAAQTHTVNRAELSRQLPTDTGRDGANRVPLAKNNFLSLTTCCIHGRRTHCHTQRVESC